MTALLTLGEVALIGSMFISEIKDGILNLKVLTWLFLVTLRTVAYLSMCCDGIKKRRAFLYTMLFTTGLEVAMFVVLNIGLLDGTDQEKIFEIVAAWGLGTGMQIFIVEVLSAIHLGLFIYLCAIAYEYYCMACDDPEMIQSEHNRQADEEKKAAAERKREQLSKQDKADGGDMEEQQELLSKVD